MVRERIITCPRGGADMRLVACCLAALAAAGCQRPADTEPTANTAGVPGPAVATSVAPESADAIVPKITLPGVFKPIPERSTDDLIAEVEHPYTKDRLPLMAELAKRTQDRDRILPVLNRLLLDGRYIVRVAAATAAVAIDPEHVDRQATDLGATINDKAQMPVYGPLVEDAPELRQIRTVAVPGLVRIIERELNAPVRQQTGGALAALATFPADVGRPAVDAVERVAATAMHPNQVQARDLLKKWGVAE
jgi:hypothetical protein